jgi:hypothetical protein
LAALLPKLINGLMKGLRLAQVSDEEKENFFNELLRAHTDSIEDARGLKPNLRTELPPVSRVTMDKTGELQFRPRVLKREDEASYASTMTLGQATVETAAQGAMFSITRDDGRVKRLKLSWVSPNRKFFLMTRFPDVALQLKRSEFANMLNDGRAIPLHTPPIVSRVLEDAVSEFGPDPSAEKFTMQMAAS